MRIMSVTTGTINADFEIIASVPDGDNQHIVTAVRKRNGVTPVEYVTWRYDGRAYHQGRYFGADQYVDALIDMLNRAGVPAVDGTSCDDRHETAADRDARHTTVPETGDKIEFTARPGAVFVVTYIDARVVEYRLVGERRVRSLTREQAAEIGMRIHVSTPADPFAGIPGADSGAQS